MKGAFEEMYFAIPGRLIDFTSATSATSNLHFQTILVLHKHSLVQFLFINTKYKEISIYIIEFDGETTLSGSLDKTLIRKYKND